MAECQSKGALGVNTGEVVVRSITTGAGQTEYTPIGHVTNLASRMQTRSANRVRSRSVSRRADSSRAISS